MTTTNTIVVHITARNPEPSHHSDTEGACDFDVDLAIGDSHITCGVTLCPDPCDGYRLDSWGDLDHWIGGDGPELIRYLDSRDLRGEIVGVCRAVDLDDAESTGSSTIEIDATKLIEHATAAAHEDIADFLDCHPAMRAACPIDGWDDAAMSNGVAKILHVPAVLETTWYHAYDRAARTEALRVRGDLARTAHAVHAARLEQS